VVNFLRLKAYYTLLDGLFYDIFTILFITKIYSLLFHLVPSVLLFNFYVTIYYFYVILCYTAIHSFMQSY